MLIRLFARTARSISIPLQRLARPVLIGSQFRMVSKSTRSRQAATSDEDNQTHQSGTTPALSSLAIKPCLTCGREITPRAKWAKNWNEIKTCSDSCKRFKMGSGLNKVTISNDILVADQTEKTLLCSTSQAASKSDLRLQTSCYKALRSMVNAEVSSTVIDVDAWIELSIMETSSSFAPSVAHKDLATTDQVEAALARVASAADQILATDRDPSSAAPSQGSQEQQDPAVASEEKSAPFAGPLMSTLSSGPGLRERVRRSARRLFVLEPSQWASHEHQSGKGIVLQQNGKILDGLHGASFAKGDVAFKAK